MTEQKKHELLTDLIRQELKRQNNTVDRERETVKYLKHRAQQEEHEMLFERQKVTIENIKEHIAILEESENRLDELRELFIEVVNEKN